MSAAFLLSVLILFVDGTAAFIPSASPLRPALGRGENGILRGSPALQGRPATATCPMDAVLGRRTHLSPLTRHVAPRRLSGQLRGATGPRMAVSDAAEMANGSGDAQGSSGGGGGAAHPQGQVLFDERTKIFRLYGKNMLYAFRVDESGNLEKLHWGKAVPPEDDLRWVSFANVQLCFDPGPSASYEDKWTDYLEVLEEQLDGEGIAVGDNFEDPAAEQFSEIVDMYEDSEVTLQEGEGDGELVFEDKSLSARVEKIIDEQTRVSPSETEGGSPTYSAAAAAFGEGMIQEVPDAEEGDGVLGVEALDQNPSAADLEKEMEEWEAKIPRVGRNTKLLEYADLGTGDYRPPSFGVVYEDGSSICPLQYKGHEIVEGKLPMKYASGKLPELRGGGGGATLVVQMEDGITGLEVDLIYTVFKDFDAVTRRVIIRNPVDRDENFLPRLFGMQATPRRSVGGSVKIDRLMSATVDFHPFPHPKMVTLSGSWANERRMRIHPLEQGKVSIDSLRGTSSHQHNPFCAITTSAEADNLETTGDVWAFSFVYSGNFLMEAEMAETGRIRVNCGINPKSFSWDLPRGDSFESPEAVLVYSSSGLEGMSHAFHDFYRENLMPERFKHTVPPVLLNTWEAMYFDVTHERVMELAREAVKVGVELLVLDDGWFGNRQDATSSLGDWYEDRRKFPSGMAGLSKDVNSLGLKFGLWVEPEMISVDSNLYKEHPEWCLNQQGRGFRCEGRNQLVLDFSREAVQSYVTERLCDILGGASIEYMKWDMNRHLTEVYGNAIDPRKQGEVFHRYMVGVYKVLQAINERFPDLRIETCSGGGGRFDPGMLSYSPQIWASDNTDVFSRMSIQHGTSLVYPLSTIGSHITEVPNHQTQRLATLKCRFLIALFGTFGLELDVRRLSSDDMAELSLYVAMFKRLAPIIISGAFYRLWSPGMVVGMARDAYAWMAVGEGGADAVVAVFLTKTEPGRYLPLLQLRGLDPAARYVLEEIFPNSSSRDKDTGQIKMTGGTPQWQLGRQAVTVSGASLMSVGIPVRLSYDGDSAAFVLRRID